MFTGRFFQSTVDGWPADIYHRDTRLKMATLDVVTFCQTVKCLAGRMLLRDLAIKLEASRCDILPWVSVRKPDDSGQFSNPIINRKTVREDTGWFKSANGDMLTSTHFALFGQEKAAPYQVPLG